MLAGKVLVIEQPMRDAAVHPWNEETLRLFPWMDECDISRLESGKVLWRGESAAVLEDAE